MNPKEQRQKLNSHITEREREQVSKLTVFQISGYELKMLFRPMSPNCRVFETCQASIQIGTNCLLGICLSCSPIEKGRFIHWKAFSMIHWIELRKRISALYR